jgi:hypothetical protein
VNDSLEGALPSAAAKPATRGFAAKLKRALGMRSADEKQAVALFRELALATAQPGADIEALTQQIEQASIAGRVDEKQRQTVQLEAFRAAVALIVADDLVTEDEEEIINGTAEALGISNEMLNQQAMPELYSIMIARANAGRLEPAKEHELMAQPGEVVYFEAVATLLKEVVIKEYRGGYGGVSFKVAKGVRINTGQTRGRMVPVGTQIQAADAGIFSITDRRAVYAGQRKTFEFKYDKLVGVHLYDDALTLQVSNRQTPSTFEFDRSDLIAALINSAATKTG